MSTLGSRMKELRKRDGVYQKDLANLLSINLRQIRRYEKDEADMPLSKLLVLASFFNVSLDYLAGKSDNPE